jgi:hypothetical protein
VVDVDGNPVVGARVRSDVLSSGDFSLSLTEVVTTSDGRFRIPDAPTGCDYGLAVETNGPIKGRMFAYHPKTAVKPGETTDVGKSGSIEKAIETAFYALLLGVRTVWVT